MYLTIIILSESHHDARENIYAISLLCFINCYNAVMLLFRLLDILADRKAKKGLSGDVLINGKRQPHNFKCSSAYVVQVGFKYTGQLVQIIT